MKPLPHAVPGKVPNYAVAAALHNLLNRRGNVAHPVALARGANAGLKSPRGEIY